MTNNEIIKRLGKTIKNPVHSRKPKKVITSLMSLVNEPAEDWESMYFASSILLDEYNFYLSRQ